MGDSVSVSYFEGYSPNPIFEGISVMYTLPFRQAYYKLLKLHKMNLIPPNENSGNKMTLTFSNGKHDFYCEDPNYRYKGFHGTYRGRLYNIVPKGDPKPNTGYYQPRAIMPLKGYGSLTVSTCFDNFFKECNVSKL